MLLYRVSQLTGRLCINMVQTQGGASNSAGSSSGGHVGITQASTFAGENGNQLSTNDIHLDNSKSNFVIGPDGKVPSLASMVRISTGPPSGLYHVMGTMCNHVWSYQLMKHER